MRRRAGTEYRPTGRSGPHRPLACLDLRAGDLVYNAGLRTFAGLIGHPSTDGLVIRPVGEWRGSAKRPQSGLRRQTGTGLPSRQRKEALLGTPTNRPSRPQSPALRGTSPLGLCLALSLVSTVVFAASNARVIVDGRTIALKDATGTVRDSLTSAGVSLGQDDQVSPPLDAASPRDGAIRVTRVSYTEGTLDVKLPYRTIVRP